MMRMGWLGVFVLLGAVAGEPSQEELAKDPELFLNSARARLKWDVAAEPTRIAGPIYFVGTEGLASFLITGTQGHVLLYSGMPGSGELIEKSIVKLGFKLADVKIILTGHAHCDHVGGHAHLKRATSAKIAMMREEVELLQSGGQRDFQYGGVKVFAFEPVAVDTVLKNDEEIMLGEISIRALLTAGHTKGSTSYVTKIVVDGKPYTVVFPDGMGVNPGYRVGETPSYAGIAEDYRRTFATLEGLKPDIWLAPHNDVYALKEKLARAEKVGVAAWVDAEGYRAWVAKQKGRFEAMVAREKGK